jgi:hypothetical protein
MSLHKSKGLTANLVVVADCIEGLIPRVDRDVPQAGQDRQLREQRRLFYVALTRTRQVLVLSSVARMAKDVAFKVGAAGGGHRLPGEHHRFALPGGARSQRTQAKPWQGARWRDTGRQIGTLTHSVRRAGASAGSLEYIQSGAARPARHANAETITPTQTSPWTHSRILVASETVCHLLVGRPCPHAEGGA